MHPARTRRITTLGLTAAATALALGTALPALADPPPGHGNGNPPSAPPGQAKQTAAPSTNSGNGKSHGHHSGGNSSAGHGKHGKGSGHNPPGNNGTVKIHSVAGDPGHHNVAHVGCNFVVDFWGFDQGQTLTVSFTGQAPTGNGTPVTLGAPDGTSITSPDPAGGGNDPDGELAFTATASDLSVLGPPAHEGYHLRLTVDTGQGGGHKYKVFWVSPCTPSGGPGSAPTDAPTGTTTGTTTTTTTTVTPTTPTDTPTLSTDTPTVRGAGLTSVRRMPGKSTPQLESRRLNQASPPISSLPFTGANVSTLITAGGLALLAGVFLRAAVRRRRKIG